MVGTAWESRPLSGAESKDRRADPIDALSIRDDRGIILVLQGTHLRKYHKSWGTLKSTRMNTSPKNVSFSFPPRPLVSHVHFLQRHLSHRLKAPAEVCVLGWNVMLCIAYYVQPDICTARQAWRITLPQGPSRDLAPRMKWQHNLLPPQHPLCCKASKIGRLRSAPSWARVKRAKALGFKAPLEPKIRLTCKRTSKAQGQASSTHAIWMSDCSIKMRAFFFGPCQR